MAIEALDDEYRLRDMFEPHPRCGQARRRGEAHAKQLVGRQPGELEVHRLRLDDVRRREILTLDQVPFVRFVLEDRELVLIARDREADFAIPDRKRQFAPGADSSAEFSLGHRPKPRVAHSRSVGRQDPEGARRFLPKYGEQAGQVVFGDRVGRGRIVERLPLGQEVLEEDPHGTTVRFGRLRSIALQREARCEREGSRPRAPGFVVGECELVGCSLVAQVADKLVFDENVEDH